MALRDRYNKLVENLKTNETVKRVKLHLAANKATYIVGAIGVLAYASKSRPQQITITPSIAPVISPTISPVITIVNKIENHAPNPGFAVRCIETGQEWVNQGLCALEQDISSAALSKHINGRNPHINGLHYVRIPKIVA